MEAVNTLLNRIHEWGEPEAHPMQRIALTRVASLGTAVLEYFSLLGASFDLGWNLYQDIKTLSHKGLYLILPKSQGSENPIHPFPSTGKSVIQICKLIIGIASTLFIGVIFSPEINFRIHLKLGLAVDNLVLRKQKEVDDKLAAEVKAAELAEMRAARFAKFKSEQLLEKNAEKLEPINAHLAELLVPQ